VWHASLAKFHSRFLPVCSATVDEATHTLYMPSAFPNILPSSTLRWCNASLRRDVRNYAQVRFGPFDLRLCLIPKRDGLCGELFLDLNVGVHEPLATPWTTRAATKNLLSLQPESIRHRFGLHPAHTTHAPYVIHGQDTSRARASSERISAAPGYGNVETFVWLDCNQTVPDRSVARTGGFWLQPEWSRAFCKWLH